MNRAFHRFSTDPASACSPPGGQSHHRRAAGLPPDSPEGGDRGRASMCSWRSRWRSIRSGVRSVITTSELAAQKGLAIVAGTQRRHQQLFGDDEARAGRPDRRDCRGTRYWNQGDLSVKRARAQHDGDRVAVPRLSTSPGRRAITSWSSTCTTSTSCTGRWGRAEERRRPGRRQVRVAPEYGQHLHHSPWDKRYPNGVRVMSMCRQTKGAADRVEERIVGTKGVAHSRARLSARSHGSSR